MFRVAVSHEFAAVFVVKQTTEDTKHVGQDI